MRVSSLFALAAPLVSAIQLTSPAANSTLAKGSEFQLSWSTVDTDPTNFSIYLVNFVNWPPMYTPLALNVETASGAASVQVPCNIDNSFGYQLYVFCSPYTQPADASQPQTKLTHRSHSISNAINGTNVYVIYAQTPKFYVSGKPCEDPTTSAEPTCAPAAAAATVTVTVSTTILSTTTNASATVSSRVAVTPNLNSNSNSAVPSFPGKCPDTIGWGPSGYYYPVTLSVPPRGPGDKGPRPTLHVGAYTWKGKGKEVQSTSTIYSTVYRDLSEFPGGCPRVC